MKKYSTLIQIAPDLLKEWHPTANINLNPRNLEVVYPKKVWWLCKHGHEWQDTIKSRIKKNGCPVCGGGEISEETDIDLGKIVFGKQRRKHKRFKTNAIAVLQIPKSGHWSYGRIKNFSRKGLCVETESMIRRASEIKLKFDKKQVTSGQENISVSANTDNFKNYNATVRWHKLLEDNRAVPSVNIGLELKKIK